MPKDYVDLPYYVEHVSILDADGKLDASIEPDIPPADLRALYRTMLRARRLDERTLNLQRQGRLGTFAPGKGQEAGPLGTAYALRPTDWMVPSYREAVALLWRGWPMEQILLFWAGYEEGQAVPEAIRDLPLSVPVGSQLLHAVGLAWGAQIRGEDSIALTYCGDGATSEGDFHEALNFAGVFRLPVVFVCLNNQYAISLPRQRQTRSKTLAQKAIAYGFPGVQVDGNDLLAAYVAARDAAARARAGEGPTLIECLTYRVGLHTTADDPTRYRDEGEAREWERKDPLPRFRGYLMDKGLWTPGLEASLEEAIREEVREAVARFEARRQVDPLTMFDHVYATLPASLAEQRAELAASLAEGRREPGPALAAAGGQRGR
jgi:pyruvate dehydrogenase E1 component alpha subunit